LILFPKKKNISYIKKKLGNNIQTMIDVGANEGESILEFNKSFQINKIYSIEPNLTTFQELKKKNFNNVEVFNFAASDTEGEDKLKIGYLSSMSTLNAINNDSFYTKIKSFIIWLTLRKFSIYKKEIIIKKVRLDHFVKTQNIGIVDLIKIDTEGHEFNVIKGLGDYITNVKMILFEYHEDNSIIKNYTKDDINNYLFSKNFVRLSKVKMKFRNINEYIFINKNLLN
tara:strand:+ start:2891 stop:3571 length:681 start_codon:yes stop_codon:yes gene_type:complete